MNPTPKPLLFMLFFFSIFGFIGIAVLVFLWGSGDGFGSPPLVFKVFGSFIALGFMAMGFGVPLTAIRKAKELEAKGGSSAPLKPGSYRCPSCGSNVRDAEVSPSGDVKCPYCNGWWNIHRGG
ncbi:MAG: hypothetical protein AAGI48_14020 [Verrucomicrobiota bacterium]